MCSVIGFATILAGLLLLATPALAVDGEILIDQVKVNAGGITPGDAPGFPATLSRPGRYKLAGNLKVPAAQEGIEVTRDNVTIDFNGFAVSSNPPGAAFYGVYAPNISGLRVMNGTITGVNGYGIFTGALGVVENMRLVSNGNGIFIGTEARIRNGTVASCYSTIANGGIGIYCDSRCLIEQNVISGNAGPGVTTVGGALVLGNVIAFNGGHGLVSVVVKTGYGNNVLFGNNAGGNGVQVAGPTFQLHPNVCEPACP